MKTRDIAFVCLAILGTIVTVGALAVFLRNVHIVYALTFLAAIIALVYGWVFYVFLRYRHARQDELLQVIATSVEANLPLAPALRAYVQDRPSGPLYETIVFLIMHIMVFPWYYFVWHRGRSFDDRVRQLANLLESGSSLSEGLRELPALASREVRAAAAIGEATGQLPFCLRRANRERYSAVFLEMMPRLIYPFMLLLVVLMVLGYMMVVVIPKFKKIFEDFKLKLPWETEALIRAWMWLSDYFGLVVLAGLLISAFNFLLLFSQTVRWRVPIIGPILRSHRQGIVLRMLGTLLKLDRPAPAALQMVSEYGGWPRDTNLRLEEARLVVLKGEPLANALCNEKLLPKSMLPLVQVAERTNSLPWTLHELGTMLVGRAARLVRRLSIFVGPLAVIAVGTVVGFVALGVFLPLIRLIEGLLK